MRRIARQAAFARFDGPALRQYVSCIAMVNDTEELEREHAEILKLLQKRYNSCAIGGCLVD
jgi:hypothetical protein